jgi:putative NADPH-quinone reductase
MNGHPDGRPERFCAALSDAYSDAAEEAGHHVQRIALGDLDFDFLENAEDFAQPPPEPVKEIQKLLSAADHLVMIYPLWLGAAPAKLKGLWEQLGRDKFLLDVGEDSSRWPQKKMAGKSARLIVTMGMPGFAYRLFYRSHSLKALEVGILGISGFKPVKDTVFGLVEGSAERRERMLKKTRALGKAGI